MNAKTPTSRFPGWSVAWAAFAIAAFSWGIGFSGLSVFLQTLHVTRGWPVAIISSAISANPFALWLGCILFGLGVGNLMTLPPLIAQQEFNRADAVVVVALVIAINQAIFAFAPAVFGVLRQVTESYEVPFLLAASIQLGAAGLVMAGCSRSSDHRCRCRVE